jgi:hypothetical protein
VSNALCGVGELTCRLAGVLDAASNEDAQLQVADAHFVMLVTVESAGCLMELLSPLLAGCLPLSPFARSLSI